jgi:hypothetical protein
MIDINDLTLGQLEELRERLGSTFTQMQGADTHKPSHPAVGMYCVIRTYAAGVHAGRVTSVDGQNVTLTNSRRIWFWTGALSCSEISQEGIAGGKLAIVVPLLFLTDVIEILPASQKAQECIKSL